MQRPGGAKRIVVNCDGCAREYVIALVVTAASNVTGAAVRQTSFHIDLTMYGAKAFCTACGESERRQLDLRHG